jgi:hypothetical protein
MSAGPQGRQPLRPAPGASPSWRGPRRRLGDPSAGGTAGQERGITVIDAGSGGAAGSDVRRGRRAVRAGAAGLSVAAVRRPGGAGRVRNRLEEVLKLLRPRRFRPGRGPYNATDPTVSGSGDDDGPTNTVERVPGAGGGSGSDGHRLRRHGTLLTGLADLVNSDAQPATEVHTSDVLTARWVTEAEAAEYGAALVDHAAGGARGGCRLLGCGSAWCGRRTTGGGQRPGRLAPPRRRSAVPVVRLGQHGPPGSVRRISSTDAPLAAETQSRCPRSVRPASPRA